MKGIIIKGIGGFETRGKFRWAMPRPYLLQKYIEVKI